MKQQKNKFQKIRNIVLLVAVLISVGAGILLPGKVLAIQEEQEYNQISSVPEEYLSSSSAMARSASSNLKTIERLQLIAGEWESDNQSAKSYEMEQEDYEAVLLARDGMKELYEDGQYPINLSSEYSNWYSWTAEAYKSVDTTFHTYTAYYWVIHLRKYDGGEEHTIWMLDDGTVFYAEAAMTEEIDLSSIKAAADIAAEQEENTYEVTVLDTAEESVGEWVQYEGIDAGDLSWKALTQVEDGEDIYYVLQLYGENRYLFVIAP